MPFSTLKKTMQKSLDLAAIASQKGEVPVGAIIVHNATQKILAQHHNLVETCCDPTAHAEMLAIKTACTKLHTKNLSNCTLFVTLEPCAMCAQALAWAKINKIVFGAYDSKNGGIDHGPRIYNKKACNHNPIIIGGILEKSCKKLLQDFFEQKR